MATIRLIERLSRVDAFSARQQSGHSIRRR